MVKYVRNQIEITNPNGHLSQEQINKMILLAKKFEQQDKIQFEKVKAKNSLEEYCSLQLKTNQNKEISSKLKQTLNWLDTENDISKKNIDKKMAELLRSLTI